MESGAPAYGLNDALVAPHRSLRKLLMNSAESQPSVGLRFEVSSFVPRLYFVYGRSGLAVRAIATHVDDISGRGEYGVPAKVRVFWRRDMGH